MKKIKRDLNFKKYFGNKAVMAYFLNGLIREFDGKSTLEIARCFVDTKESECSDKVLLNSSIDLDNTTFESLFGKVTDKDLVFKMKVPSDDDGYVLFYLIFNVEMQNITDETKLGYILQWRAMYYASSLLANQLAKGEEYSKLRKVYGIWLCDDDFSVEYENKNVVNDSFLHRFKMCEVVGENAYADKKSDLMEILFIELGKLKQMSEDDVEKHVYNLFYKHNILDILKDDTGVEIDNEETKSEVGEMSSWAANIEKEALFRGKQEAIINIYDWYKKENMPENEIMNTIAKIFGIAQEEIKKILSLNTH